MNAEILKYIQEYIDKMQAQGKTPSANDINNHLAEYMEKINNAPKDNFEGLSATEMGMVLHFTFDDASLIQIRDLSSEEYMQMPIFRQVKFLVDTLVKENGIKLTAAGNLPPRIAKEMYPLGITYWYIDQGYGKLSKETDSESVHMARILTEISGLAKKRKGVLSMTASGLKIAADDAKLFKIIFKTFCTKFNWRYFDLYEMPDIGELGFGFSLMLLDKYGDTKRADIFYAEKYFRAFPLLTENVVPTYRTVEEYCAHCYSIRTFDRFLLYFGLVTIEKEKKSDTHKFIQKTSLFDKVIKIRHHK
jgi:hypothetical protein